VIGSQGFIQNFLEIACKKNSSFHKRSIAKTVSFSETDSESTITIPSEEVRYRASLPIVFVPGTFFLGEEGRGEEGRGEGEVEMKGGRRDGKEKERKGKEMEMGRLNSFFGY
jgi:hypothetical protein